MPSPPIIVGAVGAVTIADAAPKDIVSSIIGISARSATVPPPVTCVVTIDELPVLSL